MEKIRINRESNTPREPNILRIVSEKTPTENNQLDKKLGDADSPKAEKMRDDATAPQSSSQVKDETSPHLQDNPLDKKLRESSASREFFDRRIKSVINMLENRYNEQDIESITTLLKSCISSPENVPKGGPNTTGVSPEKGQINDQAQPKPETSSTSHSQDSQKALSQIIEKIQRDIQKINEELEDIKYKRKAETSSWANSQEIEGKFKAEYKTLERSRQDQQERSDTLQTHWEVLQKLDEIDQEIERSGPTEHLERSRQDLQRHLEVLQKYLKVLQKLDKTDQEIERSGLKEERRESPQGPSEKVNSTVPSSIKSALKKKPIELAKLKESQNKQVKEKRVSFAEPEASTLQITSQSMFDSNAIDIFASKLESTIASNTSSQLFWLSEWNKTLVEQRQAILSPEEGQIQSSICKKACEILEKQQQLLDYMQTHTDLSQRERETLKSIENFFHYSAINVKVHQQEIWKRITPDDTQSLNKKHRDWESGFQDTEKLLEALEKYPKIRDQVQQIPAKPERSAPLQAEHANLQDLCQILKAWKENLEILADGCDPEKPYHQQAPMKVKINRMEHIKALEKRYVSLTDSPPS
jgi:hypothetical protein